jgi:hypothetical protein
LVGRRKHGSSDGICGGTPKDQVEFRGNWYKR